MKNKKSKSKKLRSSSINPLSKNKIKFKRKLSDTINDD